MARTAITVPYSYDAEVLRPRRRNHESVRYAAEVTVEVDDLTGEEAPVAYRYVVTERANPSSRRGRETAATRRVVEHRAHDGSMWAPYGDGRAEEGEARRGGRDWLVAATVAGEGDGPLCGDDVGGLPRLGDEPDLRDVRGSGAQEREAEVRARAADLALVDGVLWHRTGEACLKVNEYDFGTRAYVSVGQRDDLGVHAFRMDQADWIGACHPEWDLGASVRRHEVEVPRPDLLTLRTTERAVIDVVGSVVRSMRDRVPDMDAPFFAAYAAARDDVLALEAAVADGGDVDLDAVLAHASEALEQEQGRRSERWDWLDGRMTALRARLELAGVLAEVTNFAP